MILVCSSIFVLNAQEYNTSFIGKKAIDGYDVIAYFKQNKAVEGNSKYIYQWKGANWYFSTAANKKTFAQNPEKYAPQYNGYCAYAASKGKKAGIDPEAFDVYKGKLYLNYSRGVQRTWQKNKDNYIVQGNQNWPRVNK